MTHYPVFYPPHDSLYGKHPRLFSLIDDEPPLGLQRYLRQLVSPGADDNQDGYLPFARDSRLILCLLLLLACLSDDFEPDRIETDYGLFIPIDDGGGQYLHVISEANPGVATPKGFHGASRIAWRVALPVRGGGPGEGRWLKPETGAHRKIGRYATIGLGEWIAAAQTPERLLKTLPSSFAKARSKSRRARLTPLSENHP